MVVVAQNAAVEALAGACMLYTSAGNLWTIQNSAATFEVSPGDTHTPGVTLYDLRSPLGVPPAALSSSAPAEGGVIHLAGQVQVPPSLLAARRFKQERAQLRAAISSAGQVMIVGVVDGCSSTWYLLLVTSTAV
jgi:vacuolar protein sorting-associated protein 13A/C